MSSLESSAPEIRKTRKNISLVSFRRDQLRSRLGISCGAVQITRIELSGFEIEVGRMRNFFSIISKFLKTRDRL